MLRCEWTVPAARQLALAQDHYRAIDPATATLLARLVLQAVQRLALRPDLGRDGRIAGTQEWTITGSPYVLVYRVRGPVLQLLHVRHRAQGWVPAAAARRERIEPWIAALVSALLHLLMLLVLLFASTPTVAPPQDDAGGSRMKVDFTGESDAPEQPTPSTPPPQPQASATSPVQSTLVDQSDDPVPPQGDTAATGAATPQPVPVQRPRVPRPQTPSPRPPSSAQRRPQTWTGRPPGMLEEETADANNGMTRSTGTGSGYHSNPRPGQPSMEMDGFQVYYDVRSETQLRAWKEQGMTEVAIILPGTQRRMVCPLEIALRRGSGQCRMLEPDSPELKSIGDAREVINMMEVYKLGEPVWRGPGPYR